MQTKETDSNTIQSNQAHNNKSCLIDTNSMLYLLTNSQTSSQDLSTSLKILLILSVGQQRR